MTTEKTAAILPSKVQTFKAVHDFLERADGELSFQSGDLLESATGDQVLEEKGFAYLYNARTRKAGWAPTNYIITKQDEGQADLLPITTLKYYFDINRRAAEIWLMKPNLQSGTYIVRPSGDDKSGDNFAISVRSNDQRGLPVVKHYKVEKTSPEKLRSVRYYIYNKRTFENIDQLIKFYTDIDAPGIGRLIKPFPRVPTAVSLKQLNIPKDEIRLQERLGNGQFGLVWKGRWKGLQVAVKMARKAPVTSSDYDSYSEEMTPDDGFAMFLNEATAMASLHHENLVNLMAVSIERKPYWLVTELMNRGSLRDLLLSKEGRLQISLGDIIDVLRQVACGMEYLVEQMKFCHRDLRAANVLVNREHASSPYEIKVGDFGLAKLLEDMRTPSCSRAGVGIDDVDSYATIDTNKNTRLPVKWTPPEAVIYRRFSSKSDVWSFGILAYEIVTFGRTPYRGKSAQQTVDFVEHGGRIGYDECHCDDPPMKCPEELYRIMQACWRHTPEKRPSFKNLLIIFESRMQCGNWDFC